MIVIIKDMGALLGGGIGGVGYISSKSIFFVGATIVALAFIAIVFHEVIYKKRSKPGLYDNEFLMMPSSGGGIGRLADLGMSDHERYHHIAMAAHAYDTHPGIQRGTIVSTIARNTSDHDQLKGTVDQILAQIASEQQAGGPLEQLQQERKEGSISQQEYQTRLWNYIMNLAHTHNIPLTPKT